MQILPNMKMAELIHLDYQFLALLGRLDIPLGFREKTIDELCTENNIKTNFFIFLAEFYLDNDYLPKKHFDYFEPELFISFLRRTHKSYYDNQIPEILSKIDLLLKENKEVIKNSELVRNFFVEYINEFNVHINLEEETVFPYILSLSECIREGFKTETFKNKYDKYNIDTYLNDHSDIEEKLFDLKNILLKYMAPPRNSYAYNNLLVEIFRLEEDIKQHSILEEKVLIPKVRILEKQLKTI